MIEILGNPISINRLYQGRRYLTPEGREIKDYYAQCVAVQWRKKPLLGPVAVQITLFFADNRRRDLDGPLKALIDAMTGVVFKDDSQIVHLRVDKEKAKEARVRIMAWSM